jgi:hypothetical protein
MFLTGNFTLARLQEFFRFILTPVSGVARKIPDEECRFTYADYKAWELDEGGRFELIDGIAYAMPAPNDSHQAILFDAWAPAK